MTDTKLNYVGPAPQLISGPVTHQPWWRKLPTGFLIVVALPTVLSAIYNFAIVSPRYVSEARFVVRTPERVQASGLGIALQGVGISGGQTDAFAVHEYVTSRDGLRYLQKRFDVASIIGRRDADPLSRWPRFGETRTEEGLYKGLQRFVTVGYDATTGISTLRVEAFRAQDAYRLNNAMLAGGEALVNQLNERAAQDAMTDAQRAEAEARAHLADVQSRLTGFRNREGFIDPALQASESTQLIGGLLATTAQLRAELEQLRGEAPSSPQLPVLAGRIAAYERQIAAERSKMAGGETSLAPRIGAYQDLVLERELADRQLAQASAGVITARQEARRQTLYLDRIVNPSVPDQATLPNRWRSILTLFTSMLLIYAVGWLVWVGVREHRQT